MRVYGGIEGSLKADSRSEEACWTNLKPERVERSLRGLRPKKFTRAGFRPDKTDLKPERADWRLGKANLWLQRAVLRPGC